MAFGSKGPTMLALPPFRGATRRIILTGLIGFFVLAILGLISRDLAGTTAGMFVLIPASALERMLWQFVTYPFVGQGLLGTAFALLSVWFFGSTLEDERGSRWLTEFFFTATLAGGLMAALVCAALGRRFPDLDPHSTVISGMWPAVLAMVVAFGVLHGEQMLNFNFIFQVKAKYVAAIYVLFYMGSALIGSQRVGALAALANALAGYLFLRFAPRRGFRVSLSEKWFTLRNALQRARRRRAARKFTVYMRKQGKDVSLDEDGRYIDPSGTPRDPNDRRWMN